jgi:hypothetical protein
MKIKTPNIIFPAIVCALALSLHAEKTIRGFSFEQAVGASYDPVGLLLDTKLTYRTPFIDKQGPLWESTKLELGVQNEWTPADNLLSIRAAFEPVGFFDVCAKAGYFLMYDGLGYGCFRMETRENAYDPQTQQQNKRGGARGYWLSITPALKAKIGRFIMLNSLTINRIAIDGQNYFLEVRSYLPHRVKDKDLVNNAYLLYECSGSVLTGMTMKSEFVYGASLQSHRLCLVAVIKNMPLPLQHSFIAINAGLYLLDPLFNRQMFLGFLVGREFRL